MTIVGYFHICQKGDWQRSFHMIMDKIIQSGLYNAANEIRCGIVNDYGRFIPDICDDRLITSYPKVKIVCVGLSASYERNTLLHMRNAEKTDPIYTKYFYVHTKGIRWFGTEREQNVIDWINLLLYWNIEHWLDAENVLNKYDTYGCNLYVGEEYPVHYSGNFFWTTRWHLNMLPTVIGEMYNDPEFWLCSSGKLNAANKFTSNKFTSNKFTSNKSVPNTFAAFDSGLAGLGHYSHPFPEYMYRKSSL